MSSFGRNDRCERTDLVGPYALGALALSETQMMEAHLSACAQCWQEYQALSPVGNVLAAWRAQVLPPLETMWGRLLERIGTQAQRQPAARSAMAASSTSPDWPEPRWKEVASGISCKLFSTDTAMDRVSMLVRLSPGTSYPPHRHAGVEELYLLEGELWIDDRQLHPGDYNRAEPGSSDQRVWSPTGCVCLLITSPSDRLS